MLAGELISNVIPPLRTSDTVRKALERMNEFKLYHLPIVNEIQYLGLVSEEELMEARDMEIAIGALPVKLLNTFTFENAHIYEVIRLFSELQLSVVPVLDQQKNYLGIVSINNLLNFTANLYSVSEPGGIIVLSISNRNNSLAHMAQIVEADNAQILSSYINVFPDSTRLEVTLKINKTEISAIVAAFERYDYEVKAVFNNSSHDDDSMDRFDSFMNYLNV
ncbi:CBS domain-containing protein [Pedobacter chitinilyticus]|uniref:CBS domain-containing protein n=1 Tax=Pedobacter chitinilyticus TaxID=2233776 RepID=A0A443YMH0_9SPHI|nr:CBS domain-containing protein [Pedobacter chitinilyticus]RWU04963.1 CBS domain-containing protein [Pedobacter chitinilyticus]